MPKIFTRYCKYCGDAFETDKEQDNICPACCAWILWHDLSACPPVDEFDIPYREEET